LLNPTPIKVTPNERLFEEEDEDCEETGLTECSIKHIREEEYKSYTQTNTTPQDKNVDKVLNIPLNTKQQGTNDSKNKPPNTRLRTLRIQN
jgi:hypothetical protein